MPHSVIRTLFYAWKMHLVAVHHDRIIDLGTHDYHTWVDKDTRLIDAANEIVVPAFIDPHVRFSFNQKNGDNLRINRETMELFYKNGITTMAAEELPDIASTPFFELIRFKPKKKMALVDYHYLSTASFLNISCCRLHFLMTVIRFMICAAGVTSVYGAGSDGRRGSGVHDTLSGAKASSEKTKRYPPWGCCQYDRFSGKRSS